MGNRDGCLTKHEKKIGCEAWDGDIWGFYKKEIKMPCKGKKGKKKGK